jgi:endonuclease/exonuclease/phosphatase family metal-dependent hydrolase
MKFRLSKTKYVLFATVLVFLLAVFAASKKPIGDYSDPEGPSYEGNYADTADRFDGQLRVVSWNLHYADDLETLVKTLETSDKLRDADILLLQELDVDAAKALAQDMHYNYVYYPAVLDRERRKEYGNAVLSKWPLRDAKKVVLPNSLPGWLESRNAARALTTIDGEDILVYSVHLDNIWMDPQGAFLTDDIGAQPQMTILGGDFNTWRSGSIATLDKEFKRIGMDRLTKGTGYTFPLSALHLTLDHLFSREGLDYQSGVFRQTHASDHFPIWLDMNLRNHQ